MKLRIAIIASVIVAGLGGWLLLRSSSAASSSTEVKLYLNPSQLSLKKGQTFSEAIRLSKVGNEKVDYVSAQLTFPAQLINVKGISRSGSAFNNGTGLRVVYSNSNGTLSASGSGNALANPADVLVVTVTFVAKTAGQANLKFSTASQAGALLGNNSVKNALDTMVGSVVTIADVTTPSSPTNSGSGSTNQPSSSGSTTQNAPVITIPTAQPNSTSALNQAPQLSDAIVAPYDTDTATNTKRAKTNSAGSWVSWLVVGGVLVVAIGGLAVWLIWPLRNHPPRPEVAEADNQIVSPQNTETTEDIATDVAEIESAELAEVDSGNEPGTDEFAAKVETAVQTKTATPAAAPQAVQQEELPPTQSGAVTPAIADAAAALPSTPVKAESVPNVTPPKAQVNVPTPVQASTPTALPAQPVTNQESDSTPDMFEDGEQRLKREGL